MSKCDCCGEKKDNGRSIMVGSGFSSAEFWVCTDCSVKIHSVKEGKLDPNTFVNGETKTKLADYIRSIGNTTDNNTGNTVQYNNTYKESSIGGYIKFFSVIVIILSVIGSFIIMNQNAAAGIASLVISCLVGTVCYGIGEICCLLKSIDSKIK